MMYEIKFTNVDEVIRDLEQIDEGRDYNDIILADVVEWLKGEAYRDIVGGIVYEDLLFEIKNDIEDGNLEFHNTYNWSGSITHDMCFAYKEYDGMTFVVMMIHRFGDARCNYTDYIVLEYNDDYEFYDSWGGFPTTVSEIEIENGIPVWVWCNPFSEWVEYSICTDDYQMDGEILSNWVEDAIKEITVEFKECYCEQSVD